MTAATLIASPLAHLRRLLPGLLLCLAVTGAAVALESAEEHLFGRAWLEALVLAIVLGTALRTAWNPGARFFPGIAFGAKTVLEVAVVLLGASLSLATLLAAGPGLLVGIAVVVMAAIAASYGIGRALGLHPRLAILVACGNSICGNSAIAAVAPIIGANSEDVASSIAFTAVLGVLVVLGLPWLVPLLNLSLTQYGFLAGLTVYVVPQLLVATLPIGALSSQVGTVIKLIRVLMLGPVVLGLSVLPGVLCRPSKAEPTMQEGKHVRHRPAPYQLVPWFIIGFLIMGAMRTAGLIPQNWLDPITATAGILTSVAMAGLGLGVDVRMVTHAGPQVTAAATLSLIVLGSISLGLIWAIGIA